MNIDELKNQSQNNGEKDDRKYGFKHIKEEYRWMSPGWIDRLIKEEKDEDVAEYISWILKELTTPEKSRLESSTDNFDSLESYVFNRLLCYNIRFEEDEVYKWLLKSKDFFAQHDAFELCFNIQRAIEIIKKMEESALNPPIECDEDGLPF